MGGIDDDAIAPDDERVAEVEGVGPLASGEQRRSLGEEPPELAGLPEAGRLGDLSIELVDLRLQLTLAA